MLRRWYGLPIVVGDVVSFAVIASALENRQSASVVVPLGIGGYLVLAPVQHLVHRQYGKAGLSLLLRVALPLVTDGAFIAASDDCGDCAGTALAGLAVGGVAAAALDSSLLAYENIPVAPVQPALAFGRDYAWLGAKGSF